MLGLLGAHRTGKTTLANAYAQRNGIPFVQTSATSIFYALGRDPKADYRIDERIAIQEALLHGFERQYAHADRSAKVWIADRTPIDLASYLLADVNRATFSSCPEIAKMVNGYVDRCISATNRWFSTVVQVQPGIALVEEAGKAPACPAYIEHLNLLQSGLLLDERLRVKHYRIPTRYTGLDDRIKAVEWAARSSYEEAAAITSSAMSIMH